MKNETHTKVIELARSIVKDIKFGVALGIVRPEYPGEKPTPDRIRNLVRHVARAHRIGRNVFKTKEQYDALDAYVYQRLRRDGTLKKLRSMKA